MLAAGHGLVAPYYLPRPSPLLPLSFFLLHRVAIRLLLRFRVEWGKVLIPLASPMHTKQTQPKCK